MPKKQTEKEETFDFRLSKHLMKCELEFRAKELPNGSCCKLSSPDRFQDPPDR